MVAQYTMAAVPMRDQTPEPNKRQVLCLWFVVVLVKQHPRSLVWQLTKPILVYTVLGLVVTNLANTANLRDKAELLERASLGV